MRYVFVVQNTLIGIGILSLGGIPLAVEIFNIDFALRGALYTLSFGAVFIVMILRPLSDITGWLWVRRLVLLRKGLGIFSASIITGFLIDTLITPQSPYLASLLSGQYLSLNNVSTFAHLGDVTGVILLLTSNSFSQKILKRNWKRIQRLSYVYFYAGALYEGLALESDFAFYALLVVTNLTALAWAVKAWRRSAFGQSWGMTAEQRNLGYSK